MDRFNEIAKRGVLAAHDCLAVLVCATLLSCAFAPQAHAYVDPSIMTYTIQALAGVAVALSAVAGVAFRRSRKAIMRILNIDENANKKVDATIYRRDANGKPIRDAATRNASRNRRPSPNRNRTRQALDTQTPLSWTDRLWRAGLASLFLIGTVFLVAPSEMVASNTEDLIFTLGDVWWVLVLRTFIATAILALIVSLLKGKAFDFALMLIVSLGLCFYLQALFMNQSLPSADGATFELSEHVPITLISCVVWIAILFGAFKLFTLNSQLGRNVGIVISLALVIVQGVAVASLWFEPAEQSSGQDGAASAEPATITQEGLFEVSSSNNVVVFVLDTFDVLNLNELLTYYPDVLDEMTGFTYFHDSAGFSAPTRWGLPFLLTNTWPDRQKSWDDYIATRYTSSTFLDDLLAQNCALYIYTDTPGPAALNTSPPARATFTPSIKTANRKAIAPSMRMALLTSCTRWRSTAICPGCSRAFSGSRPMR